MLKSNKIIDLNLCYKHSGYRLKSARIYRDNLSLFTCIICIVSVFTPPVSRKYNEILVLIEEKPDNWQNKKFPAISLFPFSLPLVTLWLTVSTISNAKFSIGANVRQCRYPPALWRHFGLQFRLEAMQNCPKQLAKMQTFVILWLTVSTINKNELSIGAKHLAFDTVF